VPTIDLQAYKNAIKPLFLAPQWVWYESLLQANAWVICFYLLHKCAGFELRLGRLLLGVTAILLLKIVIVKNSISLTDVVAIILALVIWMPLRRRQLRAELLACSLLISLAINSIFPFVLRSEAAVFGWIPFTGFLQGSMLVNATVFCQKLFVFGSVVFLTMQGKSDWKKTSLQIAFALLVLEVIQLWIASGTPELTDPLLFLALAWLYSSLGRSGVAIGLHPNRITKYEARTDAESGVKTQFGYTRAAEFIGPYLPKNRIAISGPPLGQAVAAVKDRKSVAVMVAVYCALAVVLLKLVLGIEAVPYNVRGLFAGQGDVFDYLNFSLSLLSIGWGSAWLGNVFVSTRKPAMDVPISLLKLILVIYLFLWLSVSGESMKDIVGSNVFDRRLEEGAVFGQFGVDVANYFGHDSVRRVTDFFEPIVRFFALIGPLLLLAGLSFAITQRVGGRSPAIHNSKNEFRMVCLWLLPWLYLCKVV
ncbi:MAG: hypothetical protein V7727_21725, partial [Sneathiella sp.]